MKFTIIATSDGGVRVIESVESVEIESEDYTHVFFSKEYSDMLETSFKIQDMYASNNRNKSEGVFVSGDHVIQVAPDTVVGPGYIKIQWGSSFYVTPIDLLAYLPYGDYISQGDETTCDLRFSVYEEGVAAHWRVSGREDAEWFAYPITRSLGKDRTPFIWWDSIPHRLIPMNER